jgi:hypothetical protein
MTDPINTDSTRPGWTPSATTSAALAGGYVATIVIEILRQYHVLAITPDLSSAITGLACIAASYFHPQGHL